MSQRGGVVSGGLRADTDDSVSVSARGCGLVVSVRVLRRASDRDGVGGFGAGACSNGNGVLARGPAVLSDGDCIGFVIVSGEGAVSVSRFGPFPDGDGVFREGCRAVSERNGFSTPGLRGCSRAEYEFVSFAFSADGNGLFSKSECACAECRGIGATCTGTRTNGGGAFVSGGGVFTDSGCLVLPGLCAPPEGG